MICPKCGHQRTPADQHLPDGICPACGIAYAKFIAARDALETASAATRLQSEEVLSRTESLLQILFYTPERVDAITLGARALTLLAFGVWTFRFLATGGDWSAISQSFLHSVNLPFHEFGHLLFSPLGRFMTILGGSLFQVLVPLIVLIAFLRRPDPFAAAIMLWWAGQNFVDLSPYISDGEYRGLPLIMGLGEDSHDWGNLLTMMGMVDQAYRLGRLSFYLGIGLMMLALGWGGWLLWLQKQRLT